MKNYDLKLRVKMQEYPTRGYYLYSEDTETVYNNVKYNKIRTSYQAEKFSRFLTDKVTPLFPTIFGGEWIKTLQPFKAPLIVGHAKPNLLLVLPGIEITYFPHAYFLTRSAWYGFSVDVTVFLDDDKATQLVKALEGKPQEVKVGKFFTKALADHGLAEKQIKEITEQVTAQISPELEFFYPQSHEDYERMGRVNVSSCMRIEARIHEWGEKIKEVGITPFSWYLYNPFIQGCIIRHRGKDIGRFVLWNNKGLPKTEKKFDMFGSLYVSGIPANNVAKIIQEELKTGGMVGKIPYIKTHAPWSVPAYMYRDCPVMPWVACDNQEADFAVVYEKEKKLFTVKPYEPKLRKISNVYLNYGQVQHWAGFLTTLHPEVNVA